MLKPIPSKILRSTATVKVCSGVERYQNQTYTEYTVKKVHLQPTNEIRKTQDNTDITLRSILFVDAHTSAPFLDWCALLQTAHVNRGDMRVTVRGEVYTVIGVDELRDDTDDLHHWEVSLV
jgi:hypothetical protein